MEIKHIKRKDTLGLAIRQGECDFMRRSASEMAARASTRRSIKMGISQDSPAWATKSSDEAEPFGTQMFFFYGCGSPSAKEFCHVLAVS